MKTLSILACLALAACAAAQAPPMPPSGDDAPAKLVTLPPALAIRVGHIAQLDPQAAAGAEVHWVNLSDGRLDVFPYLNGTVLISSPDAGTYKLLVYASAAGHSCHALTVVTVGDPAPPPAPPAPPGPTPPADPLTAALQAAYAMDQSPDRAAQLAYLHNCYRGMAAAADKATGQDGQPIGNAAGWLAWMKQVIETPGVGLGSTQLLAVRKAVAAEMAAQFGTSAGTAITPAAAAREFAKIASALENVK